MLPGTDGCVAKASAGWKTMVALFDGKLRQ
jgi:hypothetical protein